MKARRTFRASRKTTEERAAEQTLRDKLQKEKPSLEDLVRSGELGSLCAAEVISHVGARPARSLAELVTTG